MNTITVFSDQRLDLGLIIFQAVILLVVWRLVSRNRPARPSMFWLLLALLGCEVLFSATTYGVTWWYYAHDAVNKYLAPPHNQFLINRAVLSLGTVLVNWGMTAGLLGALWWIFIRRTKGALLDHREIILLVFTAAAVGWPAWLLAYAGVFLLSVVGMVGLVLLKKKKLSDRLMITPYIIPAAIFTIVFKTQLLDWTQLGKIRF